jgi:hypothetical protein
MGVFTLENRVSRLRRGKPVPTLGASAKLELEKKATSIAFLRYASLGCSYLHLAGGGS